MGTPVIHFEVNAQDAPRAQQFYGTLFGWKIDANNPIQYGLVNTGEKRGIQGGIGQVESGRSPFVIFYVEVDDPQRYLDRAISLGGRIIRPVTEMPGMVTFAQFADPEGNIVGLVRSESLPPAPARKKPAAKRKAARSKTRSRK